MAVRLSTERMNEILMPELNPGDTYLAKAWASLTGNLAEIIAFGALSNETCYIGLTEDYLVIALLNFADVDQVEAIGKVPLDTIESVKIKGSFVPGQKFLKLKTAAGDKLSFSLTGGNPLHKVSGQKEARDTILTFFEVNF